MSSQPTKSTFTSTPVLVGEFLGVGAKHVFVGLDEAHRPQHAQGRALFDRKRRRGDIGRLDVRCGLRRGAGCGQRRRGQAKRQRVPTGEIVPHERSRCFRHPGVDRR
jgi:hypothetical protein